LRIGAVGGEAGVGERFCCAGGGQEDGGGLVLLVDGGSVGFTGQFQGFALSGAALGTR
jgi:hypothetical protein